MGGTDFKWGAGHHCPPLATALRSKDMATVDEYLQTWKLNFKTTKTVSAVIHLNNKEAKRELKANHNNKTLPFCSDPKYCSSE